MMETDVPYWLALARFSKFGAARLRRLARFFDSMESAFQASRERLLAAGIEPAIADQFLAERADLSPSAEQERLAREETTLLLAADASFPPSLAHLHTPPALLFVRGALPSPRRSLAVVGARACSAYGTRVVRELIPPIAAQGVVIVSGLARGIDTLAHRATLEAKGTTVAVLGGGVDFHSIYPSENRMLAQDIIESGGAVVSEFPLGTHALKHHFPIRNRLIAAFADAALVIEATEKSGSLITARAALDLGKDVLAVPGPIHSPLSQGPNNLIKMGATPICSKEDLFHALHLDPSETAKPLVELGSQEEQRIYDLLTHDPMHADEITRASQLSPATVTATLSLMEMKGSARHVGGHHYTRG